MNEKFSEEENKTLNILKDKLEKTCLSYKEKNLQIEKIKKNGFQEIKYIPGYMILPFSKFKKFWDILVYIFTTYTLFFIPLDAGFNKDCMLDPTFSILFKQIDLANCIVFGIDIFIKFLTPININASLVTDLEIIAKEYIKSDFAFDVVSAIPFGLFTNTDTIDCGIKSDLGTKVFLYFGLVRIRTLMNLSQLIEKSDTKYINIFRLIKLLLFFFYVCHLIGCLKVSITTLEEKINVFLRENSTKDLKNFMKIYSFCLLVGISSILGTDHGLINPSEKFFNVLINVFSLGISANIFGYIALILEKMSSSNVSTNKNLRDKIDLVNEYLFYESVDGNIRDDVNLLYKVMFIRQRRLFFFNKLYSDLNESLIPLVKFQLWKETYFIKDSLFKLDYIGSEFFSQMLLAMEAKMYITDETIILEGENSMDLYFICCASKVEIYCNSFLVNKMSEGEYFGETAIFTSSKRRTATVVSKTNGDFLFVEGKTFYKLLLDFPDEKEVFQHLAMKYLKMYNFILTPEQFGQFIVRKDKIFKTIMHRNLYLIPADQNYKLFYERNLEDNIHDGKPYDHNGENNISNFISDSIK